MKIAMSRRDNREISDWDFTEEESSAEIVVVEVTVDASQEDSKNKDENRNIFETVDKTESCEGVKDGLVEIEIDNDKNSLKKEIHGEESGYSEDEIKNTDCTDKDDNESSNDTSDDYMNDYDDSSDDTSDDYMNDYDDSSDDTSDDYMNDDDVCKSNNEEYRLPGRIASRISYGISCLLWATEFIEIERLNAQSGISLENPAIASQVLEHQAIANRFPEDQAIAESFATINFYLKCLKKQAEEKLSLGGTKSRRLFCELLQKLEKLNAFPENPAIANPFPEDPVIANPFPGDSAFENLFAEDSVVANLFLEETLIANTFPGDSAVKNLFAEDSAFANSFLENPMIANQFPEDSAVANPFPENAAIANPFSEDPVIANQFPEDSVIANPFSAEQAIVNELSDDKENSFEIIVENEDSIDTKKRGRESGDGEEKSRKHLRL